MDIQGPLCIRVTISLLRHCGHRWLIPRVSHCETIPLVVPTEATDVAEKRNIFLVFVYLPNKSDSSPPPPLLLPSHNISILARCWSSPWQLLQSPCSKWMIKKRWRGFTVGWYAWHPKSPRSKLAKRSELQLSSKQARHPLFISAEILMHVMKGLK